MSLGSALSSLAGGLLIGTGSLLLLVYGGRIVGISGVVGGLIPPRGDHDWRLAFLAGLLAGAVILRLLGVGLPEQLGVSPLIIVVAGLLVGFGTRLSGGCTSGHGVCGLGRGSPRSLVAVLIFMAAAIVTVFITRHLIGGAP